MKPSRMFSLLAAMSIGATASAAVTIVNNISGSWIDISAETSLGLHDDTETTITTTIGNSLFPSGTVAVANNGGIAFDPSSTDLASTNATITSSSAFSSALAILAYWDDIGNKVGDVLWAEKQGILVIQWHNRPYHGSSDTCRFQIQIFSNGTEPASGVKAQIIYQDIQQTAYSGGASATIGVQAPSGAGFSTQTWSYNTSNSVSNGTVLSIVQN